MSIVSDPTQIFIRNWEIYQKTILANYMKHEEIGLLSQKHIKEFASNQRIKILDLGCGDAHQIANQLATLNIQSYTGYDLSNQAIDLAKQHLQKTNAKLEFQVGKMEDLIKTESNTYNLLYSSFAVHHLNDEDKKVFIKDCAQRLEKNGLFILIDIKRLPGQSTDEYKNSYAEWIYQDWHTLLPEEKDAIVLHLQTCDIPVETDTYVEYAKQSGLSLIEEVAIDTRHVLLVFSNNYSDQNAYPS